MPHIELTVGQFQDAVAETLRRGLPSSMLARVARAVEAVAQELATDAKEGNAEYAEHYARVGRELTLLSQASRAEETRVYERTKKGVAFTPKG